MTCPWCNPDAPTTNPLCAFHHADAHDLLRWDD